MDFCILGPLEVHDGDRRLPLGGAKQRALLGLLLLHANEVVSSDRLVDELWSGEGRSGGSKTLQVAISRLRRVIELHRATGEESRVLVTRPPGYELRVEPGQLDLHRFEDLVAEGRAALAAGDAATAADSLREALALWRGPPLADLAYESFAQTEIARLDELHVTALEQRIDSELELGRHTDLVGELEALVVEHPLRERPRAQLVLALYRSGRQAEALEAYRDARRVLVDELGIEPGRELKELERAVLAQDQSLDLEPASAVNAAAARSRGIFVGRDAELAELGAGFEDALAGRGRLFLLVGEPGVGKSRLADELMGRARARGARGLVGRCWEAGGAPAYWPWVQALRSYIRDTDPQALRAQLGAGAAELAQLLPELRELLPNLPELPASESEGSRFRLFEAVSALLQNAAEACPLVLVLDDLHAADEPSLLLLLFVVREMTESRLLVVCPFRDVDPTIRDPLDSALSQLVREPQTAQIVLAGLSEAELAEYIELSTGIEPVPAVVHAILDQTDGNPLFIAETVRLLHSEGRIAAADADLRSPSRVRAVIGQRVGRLSEGCRTLLVHASVMGREFGLDALARFSGLPRVELLDILDEALIERVLTDVPGSPGRLRFGHALIRDTLYDGLSAARRAQLHKEAGEALEAVYSADLGPHLAELAHHFSAAAAAGVADKAIEYAWRAGDRATTQLAYEEAPRLYEMALELVEDDVARCELLLALGDAQARAGDTPGSKQAVSRAAELASALELPEQLARAALGYGGRIMWQGSRDDAYLMSLLERALATLGEEDSALRARLLARLAGGPLRDVSFPPERSALLSRKALAMARRIGDPATLAYVLDGYIPANESPETTRELLGLSTEFLRVATELGDKERALEAHEHRLMRLSELGEMAEAKAALEAMAELSQELRQPAQKWLVAVCGARLALLEGRFSDAERLITEARKLGESAQSWDGAVAYRLQLYVLRREQGRLGDIEELVRRSVEEYPTYPIWRCVLAQMAAELGYTAESREAFAALATDDFAGVPFSDQWLASMSLLAETATSLDDTRRARILYELLLPYADRVAGSYPEISIGSITRYLGLLATTTERWHEAVDHFDHALEMNERIGARPSLAHTQRDYARVLATRDRPGDRELARELLVAACSLYRTLGMEPHAATTSALLGEIATTA